MVSEKPDNVNQRRKHYSCFQNFKYYILEYCQEGSLHGLKYLGGSTTLIEKIWWGISMFVSLYLFTVLVLSAYTRWENRPVIVSFATKDTSNWQVPFPAVTICSETKAIPSRYNYSYYLEKKRKGEKLNPVDEAKFGYLSLACRKNLHLNHTSSSIKFPKDDIFQFLDAVQPNFFASISSCKYMGYDENCTELFSPVITDEGICYSFNLLDREQIFKKTVVHYGDFHRAPHSNWNIEHGYSLNDDTMTYPRRALYAGAIFSLEGILTVYDEELDYSCGSSVQGFKIQISQPAGIPRVRQQHFRVPLDQVVIATISPEITTTSEAIKRYDPKKRNCYFPNEKSLQYFLNYTQMDCQIECKTNYTLEKCGCVDFYMPSEMLLTGIEKKIKMQREGKNSKTVDKCDCMPICTSMYYNLETSQSPWNWKRKHLSSFQIFFKGNQFVTMERNELFGITDFLANFGGLLGLFVGFSLLSLIEILYFLTLRIFINIKLFGRSNWSGHQ